MKLVSAAKFARANAAVVAAAVLTARPLDAMVATLDRRAAGDEVDSPLLVERPEKKILIVVLATDRGFCGGLNSNLFRQTLHFIAGKRQESVEIQLTPWGRRAKHFSGKLNYKTAASPRKGARKSDLCAGEGTGERADRPLCQRGLRPCLHRFRRVQVGADAGAEDAPDPVAALRLPEGDARRCAAAAQNGPRRARPSKELMDKPAAERVRREPDLSRHA